MPRVTTVITDHAGRVTTITTTRRSGCVTLLAILVALFAPLTFPAPLMIGAYIVVGILLIAGAVSWNNRRTRGKVVPLPPPT
jgi:hypothetical protein